MDPEMNQDQQQAGTQVDPEVAELASLIDEGAEEAVGESQEEVSTEAVAEGAEAPETKTEETKIIEEAPLFSWDQYLPKQEAKEITPDEDGKVDINELKQSVIAEAKEAIRSEERLKQELDRQFSEAEKILPAMKTSPRIAELVRNDAFMKSGKDKPVDFVASAKAIAEEFNSVATSAQQSERVVITEEDRATVRSGGVAQDQESVDKRALEKRINDGDRDAIEEVVDKWLQEGILQY